MNTGDIFEQDDIKIVPIEAVYKFNILIKSW